MFFDVLGYVCAGLDDFGKMLGNCVLQSVLRSMRIWYIWLKWPLMVRMVVVVVSCQGQWVASAPVRWWAGKELVADSLRHGVSLMEACFVGAKAGCHAVDVFAGDLDLCLPSSTCSDLLLGA